MFRAELKTLLHQTDVLRSVLELATDSELMAVGGLLLTPPTGHAPITLATPELAFVPPPDCSIEDLVAQDFGCLTSTLVSHTIFSPEDLTESVGELADEEEGDDDTFLKEVSLFIFSPVFFFSPEDLTKSVGELADDEEGDDETFVKEVSLNLNFLFKVQ
jgi:hypothetical protein